MINCLCASDATPSVTTSDDSLALKPTSAPYFRHDYVSGQVLTSAQIVETGREFRATLLAAATKLDTPVATDDFLWVVSPNSTSASTISSLLPTAKIDERCQWMRTEAQKLHEEIMAAYGARITALKNAMRDTSSVTSDLVFNPDKYTNTVDCKDKK